MPRTSTKKTVELSKQTLAQLDAKALIAKQQIAAGKAALAAIDREKEARDAAAQETEEKRLGKLAYAAGLKGVEAGILAKAFATIAARYSVAEEPPTATEE